MILTDQVVNDVCEGPDERHGEERNAEQDDVQHDGQQHVGEPYPSAVHDPRVGIHLAVSYAHIHLEHRGRMNVRVQEADNNKRHPQTFCFSNTMVANRTNLKLPKKKK